jgi:uncharacterized membrane protein YfcA
MVSRNPGTQPISAPCRKGPGRGFLAFGAGAVVGVLGGLIGLGGAEFRLPVLVRVFGYSVRQAVPLNLVVSAFTLGAGLVTRVQVLALDPVTPYFLPIISLLGGALLGAYAGPALAVRLSARRFGRLVACLLLAIGGLLIVEGLVPIGVGLGLSAWAAVVVTGLGLGIAIGMASSLLGVAGGELIIPALVLVYGVPIKAAGTGALLVGLPTVLVGIGRWVRRGRPNLRGELADVVLPMAAGSVLGASAGGLLAAAAPGTLLKVLLGLILVATAVRGLGDHRQPPDR